MNSPPNGVEPAVLERGILSRGKLWVESMQQQSRFIDRYSPEVDTSRIATRLRSLRSIDRPVFILGCPRSGTTYLGSLLAEMRDSTYIYEPQILKYYVRLVRDEFAGPRHASLLYRAALHSLVLAGPGHGPRPVEKNPNHVFSVDYLCNIFPDALFVMITRDGHDVAVSLKEKPWHRADAVGTGREPAGYLKGPYPHFYIEPDRADEYTATSDIHRCIWIWRRHQEEVETHRSRTDIAQHQIRYEDLVTRPRRTIDGLCDFLDVSHESRDAIHHKAGSGHTSSVGRWRDVLSTDEVTVVRAEAGSLLKELGYA